MQRVRIEYDGALYHVTQRSANREKILQSRQDKDYYLELLQKLKDQLVYNIFGYILMDNHFHLLLQTGAIPLNKVMHRLNFRYSLYYNKKNNRTGHVFGSRYRAGLIQDERYLFAVLRYIHLNPVRAGICNNMAEYRWSSDRDYRGMNSNLTDIYFVFDTLSGNQKKAQAIYKRLMSEEDDCVADYGKINLIGDDDFVEENKNRIRMENSNLGVQRKSLEDILIECGASEDYMNLILTGSRKRFLRDYKILFARAAKDEGYTMQEIGDHINISSAAVSKILS